MWIPFEPKVLTTAPSCLWNVLVHNEVRTPMFARIPNCDEHQNSSTYGLFRGLVIGDAFGFEPLFVELIR
eukprot:1679642-Amphidinium_carterae.2